MKNPKIRYTKIGSHFKLEPDWVVKLWVGLPDVVQDSSSIAYRYISLENGELGIRNSYCWDGSSVPFKKVWKVFGWDSDKYCKVASLVHDALCQLIRLGLLPMRHKKYVDELYRRMCIAGGMGKKQANMRYWFLRKFGDRFVKKERYPKRVILEA